MIRFARLIACLIIVAYSIQAIMLAQRHDTDKVPSKYRTVVFLGDSNLWIGGDDCEGEKSWSKEVVDSLNPRQWRSFARSGATWTNVASTRVCSECYSEVIHDDNVVYNQMVRLIDAIGSGELRIPDVIFIAAGSNDAWFSSRFPGMMSKRVSDIYTTPSPQGSTPSRNTTLAESIRLVCVNLSKTFPNTKIVLLTPPFNTKVPREKIAEVAEVISESCRRLRIPCIQLNDDDIINPDEETAGFSSTYDGAHTSVEGAHRIARRVLERYPY